MLHFSQNKGRNKPWDQKKVITIKSINEVNKTSGETLSLKKPK